MTTPADDLRFAQQAGRCVEVVIANGQRYVTGVHEVDEEKGYFSLFTPKTFDDHTSRTRFYLNDIASVSVTDVPWRTEEA